MEGRLSDDVRLPPTHDLIKGQICTYWQLEVALIRTLIRTPLVVALYCKFTGEEGTFLVGVRVRERLDHEHYLQPRHLGSAYKNHEETFFLDTIISISRTLTHPIIHSHKRSRLLHLSLLTTLLPPLFL